MQNDRRRGRNLRCRCRGTALEPDVDRTVSAAWGMAERKDVIRGRRGIDAPSEAAREEREAIVTRLRKRLAGFHGRILRLFDKDIVERRAADVDRAAIGIV